MAERPTGVTVICILGFLGAILLIASGLMALTLGGIMTGFFGSLGEFVSVIAGLVLILGVLEFVGLYWLWYMLKKGWTLVIILEIIGIIISLLYFDIIGLMISGIIVVYLFMKKDLFQ